MGSLFVLSCRQLPFERITILTHVPKQQDFGENTSPFEIEGNAEVYEGFHVLVF